MAYQLSAAMQQQLVAANSAEAALGDTLLRAIEASNSATEAAQCIHDSIAPMNCYVDAVSTSMGHDHFSYWIDTATLAHLASWTDAMRAGLDKAEAELLEAKQQFLLLATSTHSSLPAYDRTRVVNLMETARVAIRELWDHTKAQQQEVNAFQAILRRAETAVWL